MWAAFLAVGAVGFWILIAVVCILLFIETEFERPGWATLTFIAFFLSLWLFGDFNIISAVIAAPGLAAACVAGYIVTGVVWSFAKWYFLCKRRAREYNRAKERFLRERNISGSHIPDRLLLTWQAREAPRYPKPEIKSSKARVLTWSIYWPWSMVWTLINDPIKRLFKEIFYALRGLYQKIADHIFKDIDDDFRRPERRIELEADKETETVVPGIPGMGTPAK